MGNLDAFIEYRIHMYIDCIVLPILLLFGTAGNVITIFVLSKPKHRKFSTSRFLIALAVSDVLTLWVSIPYKWLLSMYDDDVRKSSDIICKIHTYLTFVTAQLSILYIAAVTVERLICVMLPLKARVICSLRNANIAITLIAVVSILASGPILYRTGLEENGMCTSKEEINNELIWETFKLVNTIAFPFVPLLIILASNVCIIFKLCSGYCTCGANKMSNVSGLGIRRKTPQITITLVLIVITFLVCVIPIGVFYLNFAGDQWVYGNTRHDAVILLFWSVSVALYHTNNAINFLLYFLSGSKFRKDVKGLCCTKNQHRTRHRVAGLNPGN